MLTFNNPDIQKYDNLGYTLLYIQYNNNNSLNHLFSKPIQKQVKKNHILFILSYFINHLSFRVYPSVVYPQDNMILSIHFRNIDTRAYTAGTSFSPQPMPHATSPDSLYRLSFPVGQARGAPPSPWQKNILVKICIYIEFIKNS